jgi:ATP-binding cassette subfamily C exporter for protease/lipase
VLLIRDGSVQMFGPTQQVLAALQQANRKALEPARQAGQGAAPQAAAGPVVTAAPAAATTGEDK